MQFCRSCGANLTQAGSNADHAGGVCCRIVIYGGCSMRGNAARISTGQRRRFDRADLSSRVYGSASLHMFPELLALRPCRERDMGGLSTRSAAAQHSPPACLHMSVASDACKRQAERRANNPPVTTVTMCSTGGRMRSRPQHEACGGGGSGAASKGGRQVA